MFGDVPQNLAVADECIVQGKEAVQVALLQQVLEAPPCKLGVAGHIHPANDGVRLRIYRPVIDRANPRGDQLATILVAGGQQAMHLRSPDNVAQQLVGNLDLHGWFEQRLPIISDLRRPWIAFHQRGIIHRGHFPGRQIDDAAGAAAARQHAGKNEPLGSALARQRARRAGVNKGQDTIVVDRCNAVVVRRHKPFANLVISNRSLGLSRRSQLENKPGVRRFRPGVFHLIFDRTEGPLAQPNRFAGNRLACRGDVSRLSIRDAFVLRGRHGDGQPTAVEMSCDRQRLPATKTRNKSPLADVGRDRVDSVADARRIVGVIVFVENYRSFALDDELPVIAGQRNQRRCPILTRISDRGPGLGKIPIGLLPNLLKHRLPRGDLLKVLVGSDGRRDSGHKDIRMGHIHAIVGQQILDRHAKSRAGHLKPQHCSIGFGVLRSA